MKKIELIANIKKNINIIGGELDLVNPSIVALLAKAFGRELKFDYKKVLALGTIPLSGSARIVMITEDGLLVSGDDELTNLVLIDYEDISHRVLKRVKEYIDFVKY